jgi:hypothetical protein
MVEILIKRDNKGIIQLKIEGINLIPMIFSLDINLTITFTWYQIDI